MLYDNIAKLIDEEVDAALVAMDQKASFELVDHHILLKNVLQ